MFRVRRLLCKFQITGILCHTDTTSPDFKKGKVGVPPLSFTQYLFACHQFHSKSSISVDFIAQLVMVVEQCSIIIYTTYRVCVYQLHPLAFYSIQSLHYKSMIVNCSTVMLLVSVGGVMLCVCLVSVFILCTQKRPPPSPAGQPTSKVSA